MAKRLQAGEPQDLVATNLEFGVSFGGGPRMRLESNYGFMVEVSAVENDEPEDLIRGEMRRLEASLVVVWEQRYWLHLARIEGPDGERQSPWAKGYFQAAEFPREPSDIERGLLAHAWQLYGVDEVATEAANHLLAGLQITALGGLVRAEVLRAGLMEFCLAIERVVVATASDIRGEEGPRIAEESASIARELQAQLLLIRRDKDKSNRGGRGGARYRSCPARSHRTSGR